MTTTTKKLLTLSCTLLSCACIAFSLNAPAADTNPDTDEQEEIIIEETTAVEPTSESPESDILPQSDKKGKDEN